MNKPDVAEWDFTKRRCLGTVGPELSFLARLKFGFDGFV